jgi:hypothetical protein
MVIEWKGYGVTSSTILTFVGTTEDLKQPVRTEKEPHLTCELGTLQIQVKNVTTYISLRSP